MFFSRKKKNPLLELRDQILSGEYKINESTGENEVTAVVLDVGTENGAYSLLVISDGTCSLYYENGGGIIGAGGHKNVGYVTKILLKRANEFCDKPVSLMNCKFPDKNGFIVHIMTKSGNYEFTGNTRALSDGNRSSELFFLCNSVITQLRLLSERNNVPFSDDEILIQFIKENNEAAFSEALEELNNPNAMDGDKSALMIATYLGNKEIVEKLIHKGADIDYIDHTGMNPLMAASYLGKTELLDVLADENTINASDYSGQTPIMFACNAGKYECVKSLIGKHADVNMRDKEGSTPMMFAAQHGYDSIVKLLLENGADKSITGNHGLKAIDFALQNKHRTTVDLLKD